MTKQEYYDLLVACAYDGRFPAVSYTEDDKPVCTYRGQNGQKCAVGIIMPDDQYCPRMENQTFSRDFQIDYGIDASWFPEGMSSEDLRKVQVEHDSRVGYKGDTWDADRFVWYLNGLSCFQDITKKEIIL